MISVGRRIHVRKNLYNDTAFHVPGQGIYVWAEVNDDGSLITPSYKIGQYGSLAKDGKLPQ